MADEETLSKLKDLPNRVLSSSRKERKCAFDEAVQLISSRDINENIIRGMCKVTQLTVWKYYDRPSQHYVQNTIQALLKKNQVAALKYMAAVIDDISQQFGKLTSGKGLVKLTTNVLEWSNIIMAYCWTNKDARNSKDIKVLTVAQLRLVHAICGAGISAQNSKAKSQLFSSWVKCEGLPEHYLQTMKSSEEPLGSLCLGAFLIDYLEKNSPIRDDLKTFLLETFVKSVLGSKKRPSNNLLLSIYPFLNVVTSKEFEVHLSPALQKAMLRNPEIILECVGLTIGGISIDLSPYALDIGKRLISNLHSNDVVARSEAAESLKSLAKKCSNADVIENLVREVFDVFNGSNGKLSVAEQKITVLQGAGNLSHYSVSGSSADQLARKCVEHFIKLLKVEVTEKILCHCLSMMSLWCAKFTGQVPASVMDAIKGGFDLKTSTPLVRISYLECMVATFQGACLPNAEKFAPLLHKIFDKGISQHTQVHALTEGLFSAFLLVKLFGIKKEIENSCSNVWNNILSSEKQLFFSDKFLASASDNALICLMRLSELVIMQHSLRVGSNCAHIHRAMLYCMIFTKSATRRTCLSIAKKIACSLGGTKVSLQLLKELQVSIQTFHKLPKTESGETTELSPRAIAECIITLCDARETDKKQCKLLALEALPAAHHPSVMNFCPNLWLKLLKIVNVDSRAFVIEKIEILKEVYMHNFETNGVHGNVLQTLISVSPEALLPHLVKIVVEKLGNQTLLEVTRDDYFTFLTPEGELYDKSFLANSEEDSVSANMKRESKAYSYREQLEEIQLRRELLEKKKREGKALEPQYSSKQLELIKAQKEKEHVIREQLKKLNVEVLRCIALINAAKDGHPSQFVLHFRQLIPCLVTGLRSPLAAPHITELMPRLGRCVFQRSDWMLGDQICHTALRLLKPKCDLDAAWEAEDLGKAVRRIMLALFKRAEKESCFTSPGFCFAFPFVKMSLVSSPAKSDTDMIKHGLDVIRIHGSLRPDKGKTEELYHPKYLPREQMLQLVVDLICDDPGRIQSLAVDCLMAIAASGSGGNDCAKASAGEIAVLLTAIQNPSDIVREYGLRALTVMSSAFPTTKENRELITHISRRLYIAKFDQQENIKEIADKIFVSCKMEAPISLCDEIIADLEHPVETVQKSAALALVHLLKKKPTKIDSVIDKLMKKFKEKQKMIPAKTDSFGRIIEPAVDNWGPRRGIALALNSLAAMVNPTSLGGLIQFFVSTALGDRNELVRHEMLTAALSIVDIHGKNNINSLLPVFENFLDKTPKSDSFDSVRQAVVILMGSLARHLDKDDPKIKPIVTRLLAALSTPSQTVQEAVANCLPHLVPSVKNEAPGMVSKLLSQLLKSEKYGERRGAAYGLAGLVKGLGILALKQLDIMPKLTDAIQDKRSYKCREGALLAFEMLCHMLGRLFEPYIVHVLPHLLLCFGDSSQYVRTATDETAKVVMSKLSAHGVKLVLPSLLDALEEDSWRTKTGSVELLSAMAYCAPKQLSSCLPSIVPKLIEVLGDSHIRVQEAGADALKVIGSVIRNPEIQAIVPVLLQALQDPSNKTYACLQTLLDTQFVHFIDAPSLALIMPVVQRAFMDRSTETRKMAAQIIGNMYSLTDQKDLSPYLPTIIPGLKTSLLDPVPEVRSVSARALGAMVRGMGESSFEDLLPWLMQTLTSETSSVDRSGAAQGLSEVVGGLGVEKLRKLMPEIIATAERTDIAPHVKDGYIMMFIYMPVVFTDEFIPYIGQIINPILKALADENEYVRETALKAGQRIVNLYAESAIMLLLPELEKGLFDENWRIRYSSVQLLGDLLYRVSGVTGKMSTETASEDDNFGTEQSHLAIINALGAERRNRVLAGLYMGRSDVALMVRQAALHVWKVVVTNTPRTLREILPTLFSLLLGCLASTSYDKRQVAARTLGDLVRKLGERVLPEIIPILERGLQSDQPDQRQGVCIGLSEIMASTSRDMVLTFVNSLVPTVRKALCDPLPEVRQAAAKTFDSLHSTVGVRALDDILPTMLNQLNNADSELAEYTLDGLRQVMAIKSRVVLPFLVPQLTAPPVNTKALSILASVAGEALNKYLSKILPALLSALSSAQGTPHEAQELEYCQAVVLSVTDDVGVRAIMDQLLECTKSPKVEVRQSAATLLCAFCASTRADYSFHVPQLLRGLIHLCTDSNKEVLQMSWEALNAVTKTLEPKQQAAYVADVRQAVRFAVSDMKNPETLPGFCLPKGITPILPIFREAILNGDVDEKEAAAQGLGEIIKLTSAQALQPSVVGITGPLIRILGDRFSWNVKAAVLETLAILLAKVGVMLKQFLPQLQTTFLKALNDSNRQVRLKAATAVSHLIVIHLRADPLFAELLNGVKNAEDASVRETMLQALRGVISPAGDKMSDPLRKQIHAALLGMLDHGEDVTRSAAAGCIGALCRWLPKDELNATLSEHLLCEDIQGNDWSVQHGRAAALSVLLKEGPEVIWSEEREPALVRTLLAHLGSDKQPVAMSGIRATAYLLQYTMLSGRPMPQKVTVSFVRTMNHSSNDVKQLLARACIHLARTVPHEKMTPEFLKVLLPTLVNGTKEKNSFVKANSEIALIYVLHLKEGDEVQKDCISILDAGARESLTDVVSKVLRKVVSQADGKEEELDDTLVT